MLGTAPEDQLRRDLKLSKAKNIEQEKRRGIVSKDKPIGNSGGNCTRFSWRLLANPKSTLKRRNQPL